MSISDPIANMLTTIRNANMRRYPETVVLASKVKMGILETLKREGFIEEFELIKVKPQNKVRVQLKYAKDKKERVIRTIDRVSKPGCRVYADKNNMEPVLSGFGVHIISTSNGVLSDRECRAKGVGGEVLCRVC